MGINKGSLEPLKINQILGGNNMFNQTEYKGMDVKRMEKDFKRLVKQNLKLGKSQEESENSAKWFIDYYQHQYRVYA